jgi:hypothetical protein
MLAKAPNRNRAEQYLAASGAGAIWLDTSGDQKYCTIHTGSKITGTTTDRWWIAEQDAPRVASAAVSALALTRTYQPPAAVLARASGQPGPDVDVWTMLRSGRAGDARDHVLQVGAP